MIVTNASSVVSAPPNPSCCTDVATLCPKCAHKVFESHTEEVRNVEKPEPLGLPVWNFDPVESAKSQAQSATVVENKTESGVVKPSSPLGIPQWEF